MTDEEIKNSISRKALEYGVPTSTSSLFDDLDEGFKNEFKRLLNDRKFGVPIVKYGHHNGNWVIIGTREIAWMDEFKHINFLSIDSIKEIVVPESEIEKAKLNQENRMIRKFEYEILTIHTLDKKSYNLWLSKKSDFYGFWHMIIRLRNLKK